jgi:DNA-binding MarR family transcriptional regulator
VSEDAGDGIDLIIGQWRRERPDLDLSAMGVFGRVALLTLLLTPVVERVFERHGLSRGEFDVLTALRRSGPPYTMVPSALADALMMSRAGMTSRLDRLEAAGLAERKLDRADRRSFLVSLTGPGKDVIDATLTEHAANLARLIAPLTAEQARTLEDSLKTLLGAIQAAAAPPGE